MGSLRLDGRSVGLISLEGRLAEIQRFERGHGVVAFGH